MRTRIGITLLELVGMFHAVRRARMVDDPFVRSNAKARVRHAIRGLERMLEGLDGPAIGRRFASTRDTECVWCRRPIAVGETIAWLPKTPICTDCVRGRGEEAA
jgi:hypothetical protein